MKKIAVFFCTCIILIGCTSTPKVDTVAEVEALRSIENKWVDAENAGDIETILSYYATDAVDMVPNGPIIVDQQARHKLFESWLVGFDSTSRKNTIDDIKVSSSGDLAFTRGTTHFTRTTPDGPVEVADKWVSIYKKIDGKWKVIVNISNSNNPIQSE